MLPGVAVVHRPVLVGDEAALTPAEADSLAGCVLAVRRRAASARIAARALLAEMGWPGFSLPRIVGRGPDWPPGLTGSLSHAPNHVAAALASCSVWPSVGIDVEPAEPIDDDIVEFIATAQEASSLGPDRLAGRALWCAKEAAYKAMFTLDGHFLEPREVVVDVSAGTATAVYGRSVRFVTFQDSRVIIVLATA